MWERRKERKKKEKKESIASIGVDTEECDDGRFVKMVERRDESSVFRGQLYKRETNNDKKKKKKKKKLITMKIKHLL